MTRNKLKKKGIRKKQVNNIKKNKKRKTIIIKGQDIPMENNKRKFKKITIGRIESHT